jgi:hypothetical protein
MTISINRSRLQKKAGIAGILYLIIFIVYPLSSFLGKASIIVPGDAIASANNILENESLFRIGIAGEAIIFLVELILAGIFYELLKPVSTALSLTSAFARVAEAIVQAVNLLPSILALLLVSGGSYLTVFNPEQLNGLMLLFMDSFNFMIIAWGFFFGFHLLLLGYLVAKSDLFPRILGILLIFGGAGYLLQSFGTFLVPQYETILANIVLVLAVPSELAFTLFLLIKGINGPKKTSQELS